MEFVKLNECCKKITDYVASGSFASLKENVKVYNKIEDLKLPKLKKTIKSLIKEDNELYKKYDMPVIENCKTYWFNENHNLSKKIGDLKNRSSKRPFKSRFESIIGTSSV